MTLILSNDDVAGLISMPECIERLDQTYQDLGNGLAQNRPRSDIFGPIQESGATSSRYIFKTMDGMVPRFEAAAIRLNSDTIRWSMTPAGIRKDKQPTGPGGKWIGLVLLFSTRTGEPLAIMPDGVMQQMRVASTNALGVKYMTAPEVSTYALLGAGWQARGQAVAMAAVRKLKEIRVYSPTQENRERLAGELANLLGIKVIAAPDAKTAVRGADIVGMATNSITPVAELAWLAPHAHVTSLKDLELGHGILGNSSLVVVHTRIDRPANYIVGKGENPIYDHDPQAALTGDIAKVRAARPPNEVDLTKQPDLAELAAGKVQRPRPGTMTTFVNTIGMGLQFAAIGSLAYEKAKAAGRGREIPTDWLLEDVHP
jgi:ornithine cyclodeaminase/alanine dehydrogenase-like protein (mu-crystallin family)